jgi:hypothetical protein
MVKMEEEKKPYCRLQYQRFMTIDEKVMHAKQNAFCLVEDDRCPYHMKHREFNYCRYNVKDEK